MPLSFKTRFTAALVAALLAVGSSVSAARADDEHGPLNAPSPTTVSGHEHEVETPEMVRRMAGGNSRRYAEGQARYRVNVTQSLQPSGRHPAPAQTSSMELLLTETVSSDQDGHLVTIEVADASAEGFLAEAEEQSALRRSISFRPDEKAARMVLKAGDGATPNLLDAETVAPFGDLGAVRMVDLALRAHLLNPVLPSDRHAEGESFDDVAHLPAGWSFGHQTFTGSVTAGGREQREEREVVRMKATHVSTNTLLRVRAMDNAKEALQGTVAPDPNEFFAGTLFNALFPEGSTYESLMPPLPLQPSTGRRSRREPSRRPPRRRRGAAVALGCLLLLSLAGCSDPNRNVDVVSLNLTGPIQMNHESVIDEATGVLLSSQVTASARLAGNVYPIPPEAAVLVPEHLSSLSQADIGLDADWTITEELESEIPEASLAASLSSPGPIAVGIAVVAGLAAVMVLRRRKGRQSEPSQLGAGAESTD